MFCNTKINDYVKLSGISFDIGFLRMLQNVQIDVIVSEQITVVIIQDRNMCISVCASFPYENHIITIRKHILS